MSIARICDACGRSAMPDGWLAVSIARRNEDTEVDFCGWICLHEWAGDRAADELRQHTRPSDVRVQWEPPHISPPFVVDWDKVNLVRPAGMPQPQRRPA